MARDADTPVDLPATPLPAPGLGWASLAIAVAATVLLLANAVSLRDWLEDLPPGPAQAQAAALAEHWVAAGEAIGIGRPRAWLHGLWKAAEAARF